MGRDGPAFRAELRDPQGLAVALSRATYIADFGNNRVREVLPDGVIETVAGNGTTGSLPYPPNEQGPPHRLATGEPLNGPVSLSFGTHGVLWIALVNGNELVALQGGLQVQAVSNPPPAAPPSAALPSSGCDPGSIAWSDNSLYLDCTDPYELYELQGDGSWVDLGPLRPHDAFSALAAGPNGEVYGLRQNELVRVSNRTLATFKAFSAPIPHLEYFWPGGVVVVGDDAVDLDQASGSEVGPSSMISVSVAGAVRTLFVRSNGQG